MLLKEIFSSTDLENLKTIDSTVYSDNLTVNLSGWVKTYRNQRDIFFISINDGSITKNLQILFDKNNAMCSNEKIDDMISKLGSLSVGASIELQGILVKPPESSKELLEVHIVDIKTIGIINDRETYIISKGRVKPVVMRKYQHIRCKTNYFSAIMKIRSAALYYLNEFFETNNFYHLDPNVVTTSDCEGAGETFELVSPSDKVYGGSEDFFKQKAYLTVSSQLQLEAICSGLGRCYTMNTSFRAEQSSTTRHLAAFTHVEYEFSFCGLDELIQLSENMIKYVIQQCLIKCDEEYKFLNGYYSKGLIESLEKYRDEEYPRISYDDALVVLEKAKQNRKLKISDEDMPVWGDDLGSVCEKYLAEQHFKLPLVIYNYPKELKSFYMKEDSVNSKVVNCMDLIVPSIGELIGSSVREDSYDKLKSNMINKDIKLEPLDWYLDLRKNGTWRHAGGGLGFERLVGLLTMNSSNFNVRDCCPFPVAYGECNY